MLRTLSAMLAYELVRLTNIDSWRQLLVSSPRFACLSGLRVSG